MARLILSLDDQILAEYNMTKERYTVGRLADNDIRIDNPTVSGHHSLIINILNDSFLEDLSSTNGTYVNGRLVKKHALQHGDVITVGRHQLRFVDSHAEDDQDQFASTMVLNKSDPGNEPPPRAAKTAAANGQQQPLPVPKIQVLSGTNAGRELSLDKALTTLGRPGQQVIAITRRADGCHLVQVENTQAEPARVNGEAVGSQAVLLNENDVIEVLGIKMGFFSS